MTVQHPPHAQQRNSRRLSTADDVQLQIRIPFELRERLSAEALRRTVSVNLLAERALIQALDQWEEQPLP